jgi:Uma2 family endonuclease
MNTLAEIETEEHQDMGSLNHSFVQTRLAGLLFNDERFTTLVELSLDVSKIDLSQFGLKAKEELKPDVCLYPKGTLGLRRRDLLRIPQMPILAIEIISTRQYLDDILAKFEAYFALEVKSCWLVTPVLESITVYFQTLDNFKPFEISRSDTEVIDEVLDIRLPLVKVFRE